METDSYTIWMKKAWGEVQIFMAHSKKRAIFEVLSPTWYTLFKAFSEWKGDERRCELNRKIQKKESEESTIGNIFDWLHRRREKSAWPEPTRPRAWFRLDQPFRQSPLEGAQPKKFRLFKVSFPLLTFVFIVFYVGFSDLVKVG